MIGTVGTIASFLFEESFHMVRCQGWVNDAGGKKCVNLCSLSQTCVNDLFYFQGTKVQTQTNHMLLLHFSLLFVELVVLLSAVILSVSRTSLFLEFNPQLEMKTNLI